MLPLAIRVVLILATTASGIVLALLAPRRWFYSEPATSFDMVFDRIGLAAEVGFVLGFGLGVVAAGWMGRRRLDPLQRRNLTLWAAVASLLLMGLGVGVAWAVM